MEVTGQAAEGTYHELVDNKMRLGIELITSRPKGKEEPTLPQCECVGRFERLRLLSHECICHYLDVLPSTHSLLLLMRMRFILIHY